MRFTQTGTLKNNFLKDPVTIKPIEKIKDILLERLDYFIGFVAKERSELITDYVNNLIKKKISGISWSRFIGKFLRNN